MKVLLDTNVVAELRKDPLPVVDGLLAATARVRGYRLATRNVKDVARTGVPVINPFEATAEIEES